MYIPRLNVGNHYRHESQPVTEKSDQVRGFLEILALREVRLEERAGKNHSRLQSQGRKAGDTGFEVLDFRTYGHFRFKRKLEDSLKIQK